MMDMVEVVKINMELIDLCDRIAEDEDFNNNSSFREYYLNNLHMCEKYMDEITHENYSNFKNLRKRMNMIERMLEMD